MLFGKVKINMEYILSFSIIFLEFLSLKNLGDSFFKARSKYNSIFIGSIYVTVLFSFVNFSLENNPGFKFVIMLLSLIIMFLFLYVDRLISIILIATISYSILCAIDYIFVLLLFELFNVDYSLLVSLPIAYVTISLASKFAAYFLSYVIKTLRKHNRTSHYDKRYSYLSILFPLFSLLTLIILFDVSTEARFTSYWLIFDVFGIIIANIFVLFILEKIVINSNIKQEKLILEQQLKSEINNLEVARNMYSQQRKITHDFNNHIATINSLAQKNQNEDIVEYTKTLMSSEDSYSMIVDTHNLTVDAILNQKYFMAQQRNISMRFEINDLSHFPLSSNDCVIILANALDNAIEASSKVIEKIIKVRIMCDDNTSLISISNTSNPVDIIDNSIVENKNNDITHGYGIANIKNALSKYNHIFAIDYDSGWFQLTIIIN